MDIVRIFDWDSGEYYYIFSGNGEVVSVPLITYCVDREPYRGKEEVSNDVLAGYLHAIEFCFLGDSG